MATASKEPPTEDVAKSVAAPAPNASDSVRVEIFDQIYNLRGSDGEYILKLAEYADGKRGGGSEQTPAVASVGLSVVAALNIADEYHLLKRRLEPASPEARQRASKPASALDEVSEDTRRTG